MLLVSFYVGIRRHLAPVPWVGLLWQPLLAGAVMVAVGLALMPVNTPLALLASLGLYALGLLVLRPFTPDEIALVLGRPRHRPRQ